MERLKTLFDWPPVWLLLSMFVAWGIARYLPALTLDVPGQSWLGRGLIALGVALMVLAAWEMRRARTTIVPRRDPSALVTSGIFRFSRNPIYLGDELVLAGWIVLLGAPLALPLLWVFPKLIVKRFIRGEEEKMRAHFGEDFERWAARTRRWI